MVYAWSIPHGVKMSHSALAEQWEAVGAIRDKARKLELASCLN